MKKVSKKIFVDFPTVDTKGNKIILKNVPAEKRGKEVVVDLEIIIKMAKDIEEDK